MFVFVLLTSIVLGRGGQSALRFARLRMEKRHNYVRKVAEIAVQMFISNDRANVSGLILAGSADFKTELSQSDMFDQVIFTEIYLQLPEISDAAVLIIAFLTFCCHCFCKPTDLYGTKSFYKRFRLF